MSVPIVTVDHEAIEADLSELVGKTVEDTLNALPSEEAGDLIGAERCERAAGREACRAGHHGRTLATASGNMTLRTPKLRGVRFTTAIIDRHRRRETSVGEAMVEMRLAGASTGRIEDASEALRGARAAPRR